MRIVYIGNIGVADTAPSVHTRNIAHLLKDAGHEVTFICFKPSARYRRYDETDTFRYLYTRKTDLAVLRTLQWYFEKTTGFGLIRLLRRYLRHQQADLILLYGFSGQAQIIKLAHRRGIKVIAERADWFEEDDYRDWFSRWDYKRHIRKSILNDDRSLDGVICISEYLVRHYQTLGMKTLWLPPVFAEPGPKEPAEADRREKRIVYAGSLGEGKDLIVPAILAALSVNEERVSVELHLVGISEGELNSALGVRDWKKKGIFLYGRLPHERTVDVIRDCDFGILLRHNKRYAKAGFSTKFAECMYCGLPMICTKVGGADLLIDHMVDGILLEDNSEETVREALRVVRDMPVERVREMKAQALEKGRAVFTAKNHMEPLMDFINIVEG